MPILVIFVMQHKKQKLKLDVIAKQLEKLRLFAFVGQRPLWPAGRCRFHLEFLFITCPIERNEKKLKPSIVES